MKPWAEKHRPKKGEGVPQPFGVETLRKFLMGAAKKKAALVYGPPGSGKTSAVMALAEELGWELVEVNSSDYRNAEQIELRIGQASRQGSLFGNKRLILVDEVDGIAGNKDRGGVSALAKIITTTPTPIILTANDPWNKKLSSLRSKCVMVEFKALEHSEVLSILKQVCQKESITHEEAALKTLARRSGGDLRGAINDLQSLAQQGEVTPETVNSLGVRDTEESLFDALIKILKSSDPSIAISAFDRVNERPEVEHQWVHENLPKEYRGKDLERGMDALSKANVFMGRIRRQQHWRFLVYANALATAGVAVAKDEKPKGFTKYSQPQIGLKIWRAKMKYAKRDSVLEKLSSRIHCSKRKCRDVLPFIQQIAKRQGERLAETLELDDKELEWLKE